MSNPEFERNGNLVLPTVEHVEDAHQRLPQALVRRTPLLRHDRLSQELGMNLYYKDEGQQCVRSYKIRGSCYEVMMLSQEHRGRGVVAASAGNHSQGVAASCNHFQVQGVIFMPKTTPQQKVDATRRLGNGYVQVRQEGGAFDEALEAAREYQTREGASFVHPFDSVHVMEGQGTVAAEIDEQMQEMRQHVDAIIAPVGGGGLVSGISTYCKARLPDTSVIGVEPKEAAAMYASLAAGAIITLHRDKISGFVDGAAVQTPGTLTYKVVKQNGVRIVTVPENRVCATMLELHNIDGILTEPAGALSFDALKDLGSELRGKNVVVVLSGNNFDPSRWPKVIKRAGIYSDQRAYFTTHLQARPGALVQLLNGLPPGNINYLHYDERVGQDDEQAPPLLIGFNSADPHVLQDLRKHMQQNAPNSREITHDPLLDEMLG
jgi:threonine dehydratase